MTTTSSESNPISFNKQPVSIGQTVYQIFEKDLVITLLRGKVEEISPNGTLKLKENKQIGKTNNISEWETHCSKVHTNSIELLGSWLQGKHYEAHYRLPAHIQCLDRYIEEELRSQVEPKDELI